MRERRAERRTRQLSSTAIADLTFNENRAAVRVAIVLSEFLQIRLQLKARRRFDAKRRRASSSAADLFHERSTPQSSPDSREFGR